MLSSDLCDYSDGYVVAKRRIGVTCTSYANGRNKKLTFKKMLHLGHGFQKSIKHLEAIQKVLILLCPYIIC